MAGIVVVYAVGETTIYSSIPLLVSRQVLGTAFGITSMVYNAGLLVLPVVLGKLKEVMGSYRVSVMLMCGMFLLAFLACTILNLLHKVENGREGNQVKRVSFIIHPAIKSTRTIGIWNLLDLSPSYYSLCILIEILLLYEE